MSEDIPISPVDGADCPCCGVEGLPTGLPGPADGINCTNEDCPVRMFWGVHPNAPEWPEMDVDIDVDEIVEKLEADDE